MKTDQTSHLMHMMMKSKNYSISKWAMLFAFVLMYSQVSFAQTLTISDGGQTGTSGTNWSVSGTNPVTISTTGGNANVNCSVVEGYLNAGTSVLLHGATVIVNNPLEKTAGGDALLTIRAAGTNTNSQGRVTLNSNISSTSGALNLVLWSDYNNHNKGGVSVFTGNVINTNGGHFWVGGSTSAQGNTTWNGLTVGDGPAVGSFGNNYNALDFYNVDLNTGGGDVLMWAGQGYSTGTNGLAFSGTSGAINSGAGDVILISDVFSGGTSISSTGHLYLVPHDGAYPNTVTWSHNGASPNINLSATFDALNINDFSNLGGLTIGKYEGMTGIDVSNTSDVVISTASTIAGSVSVYGKRLDIMTSVETTSANQDITFVAQGFGTGSLTNGLIYLHTNTDLTSNGGDIILWSNAENLSAGQKNNELILNGSNVLTSNGGKIVLAGGLDDGANGGVANDGIPDGFAYRGGYAGSAVDIRADVSLLSGGGDIIIRGHADPNLGSSNVALRGFGVQALDGFTMDSGFGTVKIHGLNNSDHGVWLGHNNGSTTGPSSIAITSASTAEPAIDIYGESSIAYSGFGVNWDAAPNSSQALIQSTASTGGGVSITGINSGVGAGSYGIVIGQWGTDEPVQILSQAGDVSIITNAALYLHGHDAYLGNRKDANPVNGITPLPTNSSSKILLRTDEVNYGAGGDVIVSTTGSLTIEPNENWTTDFMGGIVLNMNGSLSDDYYTGATDGDWLEVDGVSGLTGFTLGKDGATTSGLATHTDWVINGPIQIFSGSGTSIEGNLGTLSSGGEILVKSNGGISFTADVSLVTNNADILVWADGDANQEGHIGVGNNVSFNSANGATASGLSGGGHIVLAGGLDDGANDGTAGDGIPDGYARSVANPGIGLNSDNAGDVSFYSGGGDVIIRGYSSNNSGIASNNNGINQYGGLLINSGTGRILMLGEGVNQYGINLNQASSADVLKLELISAATSGNAISLRGTSGSSIGLVFNFSSLKELKATDGGDILLEGLAGGTSTGIFLQTVSVLANSGTITLDGNVNGIFNKNTGNTYGAKVGTSIEASSSDIVFRGNSISVEAGGSATTFTTSGTVTLEPSGDDFSNTLSFPIPNLTLDNSVSGLTLGKEATSADGTNDANVIITQAASIAGPISIYGGDITIDEDLTSSASSENILLKGSGNITLAANKTLQTNNGDVVLWSDSDASGNATTAGGTIVLNSASSILTNGGAIVLAGGLDDGANGGTAGDNIPDAYAIGAHSQVLGDLPETPNSGVLLSNATLDAGAGDVIIRGQGVGTLNYAFGARFFDSSIDAHDVTIAGLGSVNGAGSSYWGVSLAGTDIAGSGAIDIEGRGGAANGPNSDVNQRGVEIRALSATPSDYTSITASGTGSIRIAGVGGGGSNTTFGSHTYNAGIRIANSPAGAISTESGNIILDGTAGFNGNGNGVFIDSPISSSSGNISIICRGSVAGNTGLGGNLAINAAITTAGNLSLEGAGEFTQTAAITANDLSLNGTGDFTLTNASNNVGTIAGGESGTALGNVAYRDADALALGTVGSQNGIISSGTIQVETENGDLTLSQNIQTSSSATDAIVLNAGRAAEVGTETGGDIIVAGTPTLSTGAGGISKLFSGTDANSTGLTTLVGEANVRYDLDETSDLSGEGLTGDNAYAIYRDLGNTPPTVTSTAITTATAESLYTYDIQASDAENDLITWTENTIPSWLTFTSGTLQTSFVGTGLNPANTGDGVNQAPDGTLASSAIIRTGTAAHGDGKLFFTDTEEYGVRYVDANGNVQTWYQGDGEFTTLNPVGLAYDEVNEVVYVGDYASTDILKIDNSGTMSLLSDLPEPFMLRLLVNSNGTKLYASARGGIYEIDLANTNPASNWTRVVGTGSMGYSDTGLASTSQVSQPHGMAFDGAGRLVFTDRFNDIIRRVNLSTNTIETIAGTQGAGAEAGDGGPAVDATFADPSGLVINQQGEIFISERLSKRIRKIDTNGDIDTYFTVAAGGFADDLVISNEGELFLLTTNLIAQVATVAELSGTPTNADAGVHDVSLTLSDGEFDVPYTFQITVIAINYAPSDITLDNNTINQSATGVDAAVGNLSTTDEDAGDVHTYTLVAGTGDTHNASFNINASSLRTSTALSPGTYSVRINTNDGSDDFSKAFTIIVNDDVAPNPPSLPDLSDDSDTCESNDDNITTVTTPTFTGTAEANASINLSSSIDGSIGAVSADGSGNWSITSTSLSQGTHTITATATDAAMNTSEASSGLSLTITTLDDASFTYAASAYCVDGSDPSAAVTGASGGDFTSTAGLSINASSGAIDVSASTPGAYTVTYTTAGACPNSSEVSVTINALDDASFTYSAAAYCVDASDPRPSITGLEGGTFSSTPAGLSINASTGQIDASASTAGIYTVTYTTAGICPNSSSASVTINALDDASFDYSAAAYCVDASDPTPSITGLAGGAFSSAPAGLSINASTGAIDVSASTPGTYTVTYTTNGTCVNSSSASLTINALDDASFSYSAAAYCADESDPTPSITGLEGGAFSSAPAGLAMDASTGTIDVSASTPGTYTVTYTTNGTCVNSSSASVTINAMDDPSFNYSATAYCLGDADPTPSITGLAGGTFSSALGLDINPNTGFIDVSASTPGTYTVTYTTNGTCVNSSSASVTINALDDASFNYSAAAYCVDASDPMPSISGAAGGTFSSTLGLEIDPSTGAIDVSASTPGMYTVSYTTFGVCANSSSVTVTINALDDASFAYAAAAFCEDASDPTPTVTGLAGGTFSSTPGLDINPSTGTIDVSTSTPGEYTVTYTTAGVCVNSSVQSVTINKLDDALFAYASAAYCADGLDPTPTIEGVAGGTFSSTLGLEIDPSTGAIDVSASTPGEYTVIYTTAGVCPNTSEESVTINVLDDPSFNYGAAAYCEDASDPTPSITGLAGGTFSSAFGLDLNPNTGAIDVSASIPGVYTVTYTTNGACANSSSASVTIHALDDASFNYSATTYCANASDPTPTITGTVGGTFSSTPGLELDPSTGVIDLSASTSGVYTIMYTTNGACPDSASANVTIHALSDASFAYDNTTYDVTASDPMPTVMGDAGGVFTSSAGLSINSNTGLIDVSDSDLGTYLVTYAISRPCLSTTTFEITITNTSNVEEASLDLSSLSLYPNPASSVLHINNPNQIALQSISIYDLHGRLVQEVLLENNVFNPSIDVALFESAFYLIKMTTEDSREITVRFTKL